MTWHDTSWLMLCYILLHYSMLYYFIVHYIMLYHIIVWTPARRIARYFQCSRECFVLCLVRAANLREPLLLVSVLLPLLWLLLLSLSLLLLFLIIVINIIVVTLIIIIMIIIWQTTLQHVLSETRTWLVVWTSFLFFCMFPFCQGKGLTVFHNIRRTNAQHPGGFDVPPETYTIDPCNFEFGAAFRAQRGTRGSSHTPIFVCMYCVYYIYIYVKQTNI